jgi:hypothetical protein
MNISIFILFSIIFIHWIGDFLFQTDYQAKNKSTSNKALTEHVFIYSMTFFFFANFYIIITRNYYMELFPFITFGFHWITDYFTSRLNSKLWAKGDVHNFFVSIGFDQFMHYIQLILTFYFLNNCI